MFEAAVGAELAKLPGKLLYWSDGNFEVDFIREVDGRTIAYEVKSKRTKNPRSLERFVQQYPRAEIQIVTPDIFCELATKSAALL